MASIGVAELNPDVNECSPRLDKLRRTAGAPRDVVFGDRRIRESG